MNIREAFHSIPQAASGDAFYDTNDTYFAAYIVSVHNVPLEIVNPDKLPVVYRFRLDHSEVIDAIVSYGKVGTQIDIQTYVRALKCIRSLTKKARYARQVVRESQEG